MNLDFFYFVKWDRVPNAVFVAHVALGRYHIVGESRKGSFYPANGENFCLRDLQLITEMFAGYMTGDPVSDVSQHPITVNEDWLADNFKLS